MNNEMTRALLAMTVFGAILLGLACGVSQNGNGNGNQNQNRSQSDSEGNSVATETDTCDDNSATLVDKLRFVKNGLGTDLRGHKWLGNQFIPNPSTQRRSFDYRVIGIHNGAKWDHLILLVEGSILESKDKDKENQNKNLANFGKVVNRYLKQKCVQRVFFVPDGTLAQLPPPDVDLIDPPILTDALVLTDPILSKDPKRNISLNGDWSYCEWPERPCSDGSCSTGCGRGNTNTANTNSTPPANTNSNNNGTRPNSNSNSGAP